MGKTNTNDLSVQEKALAMSIIFFSKLILTLLLVFKGILNLVLLIAWKLINTEVRTVDFFVLLMQTRKRTSDISWQVLTQKFSEKNYFVKKLFLLWKFFPDLMIQFVEERDVGALEVMHLIFELKIYRTTF